MGDTCAGTPATSRRDGRRRQLLVSVPRPIDREFIAKLGVAVDEAEESVLWLTVLIQGGIRDDLNTKNLLGEGSEIRAILSASHRTARKNRQERGRKKRIEKHNQN